MSIAGNRFKLLRFRDDHRSDFFRIIGSQLLANVVRRILEVLPDAKFDKRLAGKVALITGAGKLGRPDLFLHRNTEASHKLGRPDLFLLRNTEASYKPGRSDLFLLRNTEASHKLGRSDLFLLRNTEASYKPGRSDLFLLRNTEAPHKPGRSDLFLHRNTEATYKPGCRNPVYVESELWQENNAPTSAEVEVCLQAISLMKSADPK